MLHNVHAYIYIYIYNIYIYIYTILYIYIYIYPVADAYSATVLLPFNALGVLLDRHLDVECQTGCITHPPHTPFPFPPVPVEKTC